MLTPHSRCFEKKKGSTSLVEHRIETRDARPIHSSPYRVSNVEREFMQKQVKEMDADDIVTPSSSPWSAPVVLFPKKNGNLRFCVDYLRLNKVTTRDVYPMPRQDDILGRLGGSRFFSTLDLENGFWQVPVTPEHRVKTAFTASRQMDSGSSRGCPSVCPDLWQRSRD